MRGKTGLFNDFNPEAIKVMSLAKKKADKLCREYVNTEHILLALIDMDCLAHRVLKSLGLDLLKLRQDILDIISDMIKETTTNEMLLTPRTKTVLRYAREEAQRTKHTLVDTGDILIGLFLEQEGVAAVFLRDRPNLDVEVIRGEILIIPE